VERIAILKLNGFLLVTIQVEMHDQLVLQLQDDLSSLLAKTHARGVLIDISALDIVDSFIGRALGQISDISRVMSAVTVIVGMRPAVAITLVELGIPLKGLRTALTVDRGMRLLNELPQ
jgi:rsbT antagonist protein RsbS